MSSDYKYDIQMKAEEIAEEEFGTEFYSLPQDVQMQVYQRGMDVWRDDQCARADYLRKAERER